MVKHFIALSILIYLGLAFAANAAKTYTNPVISGVNLADPAVMLYKGTYYMYPTGGTRRNQGYRVYTSKDLVNWTRGPQVFESGRPNTWAPDVSYNPKDGKFYLYYTANFTIGVAVADAPTGPFVDKGVLVKGAIDPHLLRDDDGKLYLYYTHLPGFRMHVQPMKTELEKQGGEIFLFKPQQAWERKAGDVNEGPWMVKHGGKYYLIYSGSGTDFKEYALGYAVAERPTGPFKKYEGNPVVAGNEKVWGPGHGCVVTDGEGKLWSVYHQKISPEKSYARDICIDPLWFDEKGVLHGKATRGEAQPAPKCGGK